jgi:hypothetical protein
MNKAEILYSLQIAYYNALLSFGATTLFANEKIHSTLEISRLKGSMFELKMDEITELLRDEKARQILLQNFMGMATRTFMKESFERVRKYCTLNGYDKELSEQPWYHYARMVRNCLSHDFILHYNEYDKSLLPVTYHNAEFTLDLDDKNIPSEYCNHNHAFLLFQDIIDFIQSMD